MSNRMIGAPVLVGYLGVFWTAVLASLVYASSNTAPGAPELKWKEAEVFTTTKIEVEIAKESVDPDGNDVDYLYQWRKNGTLVEDKDARVISDKDITGGDVWEVTVTPDDGTFGGSLCRLPWRECAEFGKNAAKKEITVKDSPPRARVRYFNAEGREVTQMEAKKDITPRLSCMDPDVEKERARAMVKAEAEGKVLPPPDPAAPDPCTYTIEWVNVDVPLPEGQVNPYTQVTLPGSATKSGETWKAVVTATANGVTGNPIEAKIRIL